MTENENSDNALMQQINWLSLILLPTEHQFSKDFHNASWIKNDIFSEENKNKK